MSNEKNESYYKILGTTANIGNARIKEKYIQAVKKHPPEIDPEGFEKVRQAYETLRDPEKRKQYDLMRKYGANVEKLLEEAFHAIASEDVKAANKILKRAGKISPNNPSVMLGSMMLAIESGDLVEAEDIFEKILATIIAASDEEECAALYSIKAKVLIDHEYFDEALELLKQGEASYPDYASLFTLSFIAVYMQAGLPEEAWKSLNTAIPTPEEESLEDLELFVTWADFMMELGKWNERAKVQSRFRKFIKNITDEEEKEIVSDYLEDHFQWLFEDGEFRFAEFYIDLLIIIDNKDTDLKEKQSETKKLARVQKEIERLAQDDDTFPLLYIHAFEWFYEGILPSEQLFMMKNSLPSEIIDELRQAKEVYAASILRLHKKYPSIYKQYKEKWDNLFNELTQGFNRETKRELRKIR